MSKRCVCVRIWSNGHEQRVSSQRRRRGRRRWRRRDWYAAYPCHACFNFVGGCAPGKTPITVGGLPVECGGGNAGVACGGTAQCEYYAPAQRYYCCSSTGGSGGGSECGVRVVHTLFRRWMSNGHAVHVSRDRLHKHTALMQSVNGQMSSAISMSAVVTVQCAVHLL
jgi:hypothetical protein